MGSDQQSSAASGHLRTARFAESAAEAPGVDRTMELPQELVGLWKIPKMDDV